MKHFNLKEEKRLWRRGYQRIACLDEAGRGPLAGPVVAAAVVLLYPLNVNQLPEVKDSKKLSPKKREDFYRILISHSQIKWGTGRVSEKVIDKINILQATRLAMNKAFLDLERKILGDKKKNKKIDFLILDGKMNLDLDIPQKSIIKADEKVFSCICAGIIAKVKRDKIMQRYDKFYPQYGFKQHKGYPTKLHKIMLKKYGSCKIHRMSFAPLKGLNRE